MFSIKTTFNHAAFGHPGSDTFWLLIWILFIIDDRQRREQERRKKRERDAGLHLPKPPGW
jgi:hypothetical protein